jgi:hypothetical protein
VKRSRKLVVWLNPSEDAAFEHNRKAQRTVLRRADYARSIVTDGALIPARELVDEMRRLAIELKEVDAGAVERVEALLLRALEAVVTP